jgi:hypothetical protein
MSSEVLHYEALMPPQEHPVFLDSYWRDGEEIEANALLPDQYLLPEEPHIVVAANFQESVKQVRSSGHRDGELIAPGTELNLDELDEGTFLLLDWEYKTTHVQSLCNLPSTLVPIRRGLMAIANSNGTITPDQADFKINCLPQQLIEMSSRDNYYERLSMDALKKRPYHEHDQVKPGEISLKLTAFSDETKVVSNYQRRSWYYTVRREAETGKNQLYSFFTVPRDYSSLSASCLTKSLNPNHRPSRVGTTSVLTKKSAVQYERVNSAVIFR